MSFFPDSNGDPKKEEVLSEAPYLRTFLDKIGQGLNFDKWQSDLGGFGAEIEKGFEARLGKNWFITTIAPLVAMTHELGILNPTLDVPLKTHLVQALVKFGYELETVENGNVILTNLVERFRDIEAVNPAAVATTDGKLTIVNSLMGLLTAGMYIKGLPLEGDSTLNTTDNPSTDPLSNFIEGLDLKDI